MYIYIYIHICVFIHMKLKSHPDARSRSRVCHLVITNGLERSLQLGEFELVMRFPSIGV